jgi:hypothetical protein
MFSRLSRLLSRSKRSQKKSKPLPVIPPELILRLASDQRPPSSWSGHSSSCSIQSDPAPSFLEVVCNDSQPVYCMETVPLYNPSSLPPGTRNANSLYESAHQEILRERMRVTESENVDDRDKDRRRKLASGVRHDISRHQSDRGDFQGRNSLRPSDPPAPRNSQMQQRYGYRDRHAEDYTSTDHYVGAPIYRDGSVHSAWSSRRSQMRLPLNPSDYMDPDYHHEKSHYQSHDHSTHPRPPTHSGPFRSKIHRSRQEPLQQNSCAAPSQHRRDSIPAEQYFTRESSIRQGPYHLFQHQQTPNSPYDHPDLPDNVRGGPSRHLMDDFTDVPMTRMTRLKEPARTFGRDDGMTSDVGIGLGRISGMAASRTASLRSRRGTQSDIGVGRRDISLPSQPLRGQEKVSKVLVY